MSLLLRHKCLLQKTIALVGPGYDSLVFSLAPRPVFCLQVSLQNDLKLSLKPVFRCTTQPQTRSAVYRPAAGAEGGLLLW